MPPPILRHRSVATRPAVAPAPAASASAEAVESTMAEKLAPAVTLDSEGCYRALKARDARFDGQFFTGVTSTGIYCRPVCKVRTPRRENCRFFGLPAQAEAAGFRPCLRCRPEVAPAGGTMPVWSTQDASGILARQAAAMLDAAVRAGAELPSMAALARHLGVSERHLRRIFEAQWGISPLQYLQTQRLLLAKQLLTDTTLAVAQVASLSGFASLRRFNAAFLQHYRLQPRALRKTLPHRETAIGASSVAHPERSARGQADARSDTSSCSIRLRLAYRPPYDVAALLGFFQQRGVPGVEWVEPTQQRLARTLQLPWDSGLLQGWVRVSWNAPEHSVLLEVSDSLAPALPAVQSRVRHWLDLDADPTAMAPVLQPDFAGLEGMRVPGTVDGFELAVRAVLGQQITVAAARTMAQRLTERFGTTVQTPWPALHRCFPTANALAQVPAEALGALGIVRQRQGAILALARACSEGALRLEPGGDVQATVEALVALPGIGAWTASYIAMRALRWPDAFPAADVALQNRLGVRHSRHPAQAAEQASLVWRPWRSYAVLRVWHGPVVAEPVPSTP